MLRYDLGESFAVFGYRILLIFERELVPDVVGQLDRQVEMHALHVPGQGVRPRRTETRVPARFEDIHALEETDVTLKSLKLVT